MSKKTIKLSALKKIIEEQVSVIIDTEKLEDLEAAENSWSGGENLTLSIDHAGYTGELETVKSPETLSIVDDRGVYRMTESSLRHIIRDIVTGK